MDRLARNVPKFNGQKYGLQKFKVCALSTELKVIQVIDLPIPETISNSNTNLIISVQGDSCISRNKIENF